jgi:endonuclease/exonuclease/phosphatase family metal-dependent hydrolase
VGDNPCQGLAVLSAPGWRVEPIALTGTAPRWMVPFRVSGPLDFTLVAVWVLPLGSSYSRAACEGIDALAEVIGAGPSVLMGDFNANPVFDRPGARFGYRGIEARLDALGCASAWHAHHRQPPGEESHPTYFHTWKRELPMHLDYCFLPRPWLPRVVGVEIGGYEDWRGHSDHRPLIVDLTL